MTPGRIRYTLAIMLLAPTCAWAGPEWPEGGDAGNLPDKAQKIFGSTVLDKIAGDLDGLVRASDFQDMFLIRIYDYPNFSMSTEMGGLSDTTFNVQLFLFNKLGMAQLANDDISTGNLDAALTDVATDGTGFALSSNGYYFVAISGFDSDPQAFGMNQFIQATTIEVSGPDGPSATIPIDGWSGAGATGHYRVFLSGAEMVCLGDIDGDNIVNGVDLAALLAAWGADDYFADFSGDDTVDGVDLAALLAAWGTCP